MQHLRPEVRQLGRFGERQLRHDAGGFDNAWIGGLFAAVALTGLAVLVATLFNLITDLVGGVRLTVLEEEVVERTSSPMRRFATASVKRQGPPPAATVAPTPQGGAEARVRRAREA